ncbi:MAG: acyl--CoA ligase [Rhodobacteraceae bacterium]|nr:acyl--CoA ligase [Paracoccaceae bacterium]
MISLFDDGPPPPCPVPFNMAGYVLAAADRDPDKVALEVLAADHSTSWTYRALARAVFGTGGGLQALGLPIGARIMLRIGNTVDFPILFLGAIAAGYVPVPTSSQLTEPETRALIADLDPALIVFGDGVEVLGHLPCPALLPGELAALAQHPAIAPVMGDPNRLGYIIYTSGTSGKPRAVMHAHRAVWARRMMWDGWYGLRPDDRLLHAGAFNWTYTLGTGLMDPWAIGATAMIPDPNVERTTLAALLHRHKASIFAAAPGVYRQLLMSGADLDLPDLRHGLSAGEKLPAALQTGWSDATGTKIFEALGMSEVSTFISTAPGHAAAPGISGRPQQGRRVAVLDPDNHQPVPCDQPGILAISSRDPGLMLGYRNAPDETAQKFAGEWFLSGDIVSMAADGAISYLGRDDDMMNAGGYRVSPIEVETALNQHPDIRESAAVAVEIKPGVFVIAAFYQSGLDLSEAALAVFCAERLARYKCPRLFVRLDELPKGANNKLKRGELRQALKGTT